MDNDNYVHGLGEDFGNYRSLDFGRSFSLSEFHIKNGFQIGHTAMHFPTDYVVAGNYTFFITFKHDTSLTQKNSYAFGFGKPAPYVIVENNKFKLYRGRSLTIVEENVLPSHRNKQLMLWFVVKGNKHQVALDPGFSNITETFK